jgi:hypothetical protein
MKLIVGSTSSFIKHSATSLLVAIRASGSPLGLHPERDIVTDLYFGSTPIAYYDECNRRSVYKRLQEIYDIATRDDQGMDISFGTPPKIDLDADLYSGSTLVTNYDGIGSPDPNGIFRPLNTYPISL